MPHVPQYAYAVICVVAPVAWGLLMVWVTSSFEHLFVKRSGQSNTDGKAVLPPIEYHI